MANRIVQITDEYGDYIYPLCGEGLILPAFTTKGMLTEANMSITSSTTASISIARLHYGFTSDKNIGLLGGFITFKGTGGSNMQTIATGLTVGTAPSGEVKIFGPMTGTSAQSSISLFPHISILTDKSIVLKAAASTNNTTFWIPPMIIRFSDFY